MARANVPDIMLVDIGLPGMNGYDIARAIRSDGALRHIVLVALTGYGQSEDKAQALAAGFDYHLVKPVDLQALATSSRA
jgi:CheY-like chemotaxis protein